MHYSPLYLFGFTAFKIHWPTDACFKPCPTKSFINNFKVEVKN